MEPLVVLTRELATVLRDWMDKHDARFPSQAVDVGEAVPIRASYRQNGRGTGTWGFSSRAYLRKQGFEPRSVYRILTCESQYTGLSLADALLTAIERGDLLDNGIHVVPNPRYTQERWIEAMEERGCVS